MLFCLTRLVTRTKESNWRASLQVSSHTPAMEMLVGIFAPWANWLADKGLSLSASFRTRKMVNYACAEWIQRKLWWRFAPALTCKSFAIFGHRGERLIEPSSTWFPLKFPSELFAKVRQVGVHNARMFWMLFYFHDFRYFFLAGAEAPGRESGVWEPALVGG